MSRDLHSEPFDEGTKAKLLIFEDYVKSWLPVFLASGVVRWNKINLFDFFAGPGADVAGFKGTPLIIIYELFPYHNHIKEKGLHVSLYFNEFDQKKCSTLKKKVEELQKKYELPYQMRIEEEDFKNAFDKNYQLMSDQDSANLILLDQSGIKHITPEVFQKIVNLKATDFLFFISSSTIRRFSELPTIRQYINVNKANVEATEYYKVHRVVLDYYRSLLPSNRRYYLAPFSIKKGPNIYGLIFGSGHILGIQKFLTTCWKADPERGEANFDIDKEKIIPGQFGLFTGRVEQTKKVDYFENELRSSILQAQLVTDEDVYIFSITNGFLPKNARKVVKELIIEGKLKKASYHLDYKVTKPNVPKTKLELIGNAN
ncbi:MAG: three-Cys-motif partner protein TcmP [Ignavibacteriae bacterium]|nr:three-Cys-motif partner protein TcmP [Ignavibacteriota bacterium]